MKKRISVLLLLISLLFVGVSCAVSTPKGPVEVTDMVGRKVEVTPGSYKKVVCIGAGALRLYAYVGDAENLGGVEDIDNETAEGRPVMFDAVARPYYMAIKETTKTVYILCIYTY